MSSLLTKLLSWILALLYCCHLAFAFLNCGACMYGPSLLCPDYIDKQFEVKIEADVKRNTDLMLVTCSFKPVNYSLLEGCSFPNVNYVKFSLCPFTNESFADIFRKIGVNVEKVESVKVYHPLQYVETLGAHHLAGLTNLTFLDFEEAEFSFIDADTFHATPNLQILYFRGNDIQIIPKEIFQPLTNLSILNLNHNNLPSIPAGLFDSLRELKNLYLWKNNLNDLPPKVFDHLISLQNLTLMNNNLTSLDKDLFEMNSNLSNVNFKRNNIQVLPEGLFQNCSKLNTVKFPQNKLESIPENMFASNINLQEVDFSTNKLVSLNDSIFGNLSSLNDLKLSTNRLRTLPSLLFSSTTSLKKLDLSNNALETLPKELFYATVHLQTLDLSNNSLSMLPDTLFLNTASLEKLYLNKNALTELSFNSFYSNSYSLLKEIYLSYNNLTIDGIMHNYVFALNTQLNLEVIDLSYNQFVGFPTVANFFNFVKLKKLNLEGNLLRGMLLDDLLQLSNNVEVNLKFNRITTAVIERAFENKIISVYLEGNNFTCDCQLFDLVKLVKQDSTALSQFSYYPVDPSENPLAVIRVMDGEKLVCQRPSFLSNQPLSNIDLFDLSCQLKERECTYDCPCYYRKADEMITVSCEYKNLYMLPNVTYFSKIKNTEISYTLNLSGNSITSFNLSSYPYITTLILSNNGLTAENLAYNTTVLPPKLKLLDLSGNNLTFLNKEFVSQVNRTGTHIDLTDNPWVCNCDIKPLHNFVQEKYHRITNFRKITCKDKENTPPLGDLKEEDVCPFYLKPMVLTTIVVFIILLVLFAVLGTVSFYRYKTRIKVWLYTHRLCLWLVTEDELDVDKQYDAFISYSHKDEDFVNNILVPELENGDPSYRLCLHYRDWVAGEFIQNQITNSVHSSRRTLVILSTNFIESIWGQMEFRAAHEQALQDKTNRVIVIVYGEMPPEESLDKELLHYVKLHTYLKWGNPRFWENLRYAMPHPRHLLKKKKKRVRTNKLELVNGHVIKDNAVHI